MHAWHVCVYTNAIHVVTQELKDCEGIKSYGGCISSQVPMPRFCHAFVSRSKLCSARLAVKEAFHHPFGS